jgi:hypothetical protein
VSGLILAASIRSLGTKWRQMQNSQRELDSEGAYLMLGACLGMGPLVLRNGPGAMSPDRLKALIK